MTQEPIVIHVICYAIQLYTCAISLPNSATYQYLILYKFIGLKIRLISEILGKCGSFVLGMTWRSMHFFPEIWF